MLVTEMQNLWIGKNDEEGFMILICAWSADEAQTIANSYQKDAGLSGHFEIIEFEGSETNFDCDYILTTEDKEDKYDVLNTVLAQNAKTCR